ncbi:MAG: hypothetical protein ABIO05_01450, partial [Ferruginibacter sp.]
SSPDINLIEPVSYIFIERISAFYKDLKIRKAQTDYNFTLRKIDSLEQILNVYDRRAIRMNNTTLFTPLDRIQYSIPKENLANAKERVMRQRDASANNREEALWRLQKVTPIIAVLDKPEGPFVETKPSTTFYGIIGFVLGAVVSILLVVSGVVFDFVKSQTDKMLEKGSVVDTTVSTTI